MSDIEKNKRFHEHFTRFRTPKEKTAEMPFMDTAILISNYVDKANLATIKDALINISSPLFKHFEQHASKAAYVSVFGACLYGKFVLDEYMAMDGLDSDEKRILNAMRTNLEGLYTSPRTDTADKLTQLISNGHLWLTNHALKSKDLTKAKALSLSLYTALKLVHINLDNISTLLAATAWVYNVKIPLIKIDLSKLNKKFARTVTELDHLLAPPSINPAAATVPIEPLTLEQHLNTEYLATLEQEDIPFNTRLTLLKQQLTDTTSEMSTLIDEKIKQSVLDTQITQAASIILALDENEKSVTGKKYALDLIQTHQNDFDSLIKHGSPPEKTEWLARLNELSNPDLKRYLNDHAQYVLSTLSHPFALMYRSMLPTHLQKRINDKLPITFDTECKISLRIMAEARVAKLSDIDLLKSKQTIERSIFQIARSNETMKSLVFHSTTHELNHLVIKNQAMIEALTEYERIRTHIMSNHDQLRKISKLSPLVDVFLQKHNHFVTKLLFVLSRICSFFKTKTVINVQAVKAMRSTINELKISYNAELDADRLEISSNPVMPSHIKEKLAAMLVPIQNSPPVPKKLAAPAFKLVSTLFKDLDKPPKNVEVALPSAHMAAAP